MLRNRENLIIFILLVVIGIIYFKKYYKKEDFEVIFSPYYPISNQVITKTNNYLLFRNNGIFYLKISF